MCEHKLNENAKVNTKKKIEMAFLELYREKEIDKISIQEITNKANVHRGTFYYYFKDIYNLLESIENKFLDGAYGFLERMVDMVLANDFERNCDFIDNFFSRHDSIVKIFLIEKPNFELIRKVKNTGKSILLNKLGICEDKLSAEQKYIMEAMSSTGLSVWTMWIKNKEEIKTKDLISLVRDANLKAALNILLK